MGGVKKQSAVTDGGNEGETQRNEERGTDSLGSSPATGPRGASVSVEPSPSYLPLLCSRSPAPPSPSPLAILHHNSPSFPATVSPVVQPCDNSLASITPGSDRPTAYEDMEMTRDEYLTLLHPCGRRHPDSVNSADSEPASPEARPASEERRRERRVSKDKGGGER
ncbi:unnamed protein product [Pleuronectes platessa]|uniref:Uncharacterized protein n=1 Tax=Pleuronectes platessa TaxID=8262 RepID=A0A9N7VHM5_PLEPL|nr:unnamed protein product [Pleuronectes platessa]